MVLQTAAVPLLRISCPRANNKTPQSIYDLRRRLDSQRCRDATASRYKCGPSLVRRCNKFTFYSRRAIRLAQCFNSRHHRQPDPAAAASDLPEGNAVADFGPWIPRLTAGATPRATYAEKARPRPTGVCARPAVKRSQKIRYGVTPRGDEVNNVMHARLFVWKGLGGSS